MSAHFGDLEIAENQSKKGRGESGESVEQNMASKRNTSTTDKSLDDSGSTSKAVIKESDDSQETVKVGSASSEPEKAADQGAGGEEAYYFTRSQYVQHYYAEYMNLYHLLDRGLATVQSELHYMSRKMYKLADNMKECSNTIDFYVSRMLSFQKEMLNAVGKTNSSLQTMVHLLHDIKENQHSSNAAERVERHMSVDSDEDGANQKEQQKRHRSRSGDCSTRQRRRYNDRK